MKKNIKGFTLIELLAVIVILAIIALIATPIVLNLIERARKGAAESSAYAYIKSSETAAVVELMSNTSLDLANKTCKVQATQTQLSCEDSDGTVLATLTIDVKGDLPKEGSTITFNAQGSVTEVNFNIGAYNVTLNEKREAVATKGTSASNPSTSTTTGA